MRGHRSVGGDVSLNFPLFMAKQRLCPSNTRRWFRQFSHHGFWCCGCRPATIYNELSHTLTDTQNVWTDKSNSAATQDEAEDEAEVCALYCQNRSTITVCGECEEHYCAECIDTHTCGTNVVLSTMQMTFGVVEFNCMIVRSKAFHSWWSAAGQCHQHNTTQHSTAQHNTTQHNTPQHSTV